MSKKLRGFTLVEALVIMTVVAVLLAATTRLVTRKALNAPEKNQHGRYEAYYEGDQGRYVYFNGSGKVVDEGDCKEKASDGRAVCKFVPPSGSENFHIQAVGGGGAGGSAGGSGPSSPDGSGTAKAPKGSKPIDVNGGKLKTPIDANPTTPFSEYLDLRAYNEGNEDVKKTYSTDDGLRNTSDKINADHFKVSVFKDPLPYGAGVFYEKFPAPTKWPKTLGSSKEKPEYGNVPNWFDWGTAPLKVFDVVASACSSKGGQGGDFIWSTKPGADYTALRLAYTSFKESQCTDLGANSDCSCIDPRSSKDEDGKTHNWCAKHASKYSQKITCTPTAYYSCRITSMTRNACSCSGFGCDTKNSMATRAAKVHTSKIEGQDGGDGPNGTPIIDPANWGCGMVTSSIVSGMSANAKLSGCSIAKHGEHEMALNCPSKGDTLTYTNKGTSADVEYACGGRGPKGATGVAKISTVGESTAIGGQGGKRFCPEISGWCTPPPDENTPENRCKYDFSGDTGHCGSRCSGPVVSASPYPFCGPGKVDGKANKGEIKGSPCKKIGDYNYCRTGLYNYEYSYEMARGFKQLAYGDAGGAGKLETKTVGQINGPVKITLGKGGEWKNTAWMQDETSRGPDGSATIVGNYLTIDGGAGGQGALKSDRYELCSIFDKEHCKLNNKPYHDPVSSGGYGISRYYRIQPGTKGEITKIDTSYKDSRLTGKTPGKGGNSMGTISTREFICNTRAVYNLMATTGDQYKNAFKYNGYKIVLVFKQAAVVDNLCATEKTNGVGNEYYYEPDANKSNVSYRQGKDVAAHIRTELKGDDAAVIITW